MLPSVAIGLTLTSPVGGVVLHGIPRALLYWLAGGLCFNKAGLAGDKRVHNEQSLVLVSASPPNHTPAEALPGL